MEAAAQDTAGSETSSLSVCGMHSTGSKSEVSRQKAGAATAKERSSTHCINDKRRLTVVGLT